ncbi:hypothetical protein E4U22_007064 [Claviceps purpurea]|nr:hypothetical protein E4U34_001834 [Claviceps purpurea]KAG6308781.1 hypothetical protein E4U45_006694 [Claviceps purpurea]KAG6316471.1 hypothetical protein E4U22_007064 [Claviceps purpurea]
MGIAVRPFKVSVRRRTPVVILFCAFFLLLLAFGAFERSESRLQYALPLGLEEALPERLRVAKPCRSDLDFLRRTEYKFTKQIVYQKRCVRGVRNASNSRDVVGSNAQPLIDEAASRVLDLRSACNGSLPADSPCDPISLPVPVPFPQRDYSEFVFAVASSAERLEASIPQFKHWLQGTKARLVAIVTDQHLSKRQMAKLTGKFNQSGINFIGTRPRDLSIGVNEQHFIAVRDLLQHAEPDTKWGVIIDDDTFFPSLFPVAQIFDKQNASLPAYVGGLSENKDAVSFHGYMAYGGGGVFLSVPLLKLLEPHVDSCLRESRIREGDGMLKFCVEKTGTNFTEVKGLHQLDFKGDMGGFYESGKWHLSLHHWKSWHQAPVDKIGKIAQFCGGCLFQRWRFASDTLFTNGYSIATYKSGTANLQLDRMESTFTESGNGDDWEWSLGPMRNRVPEGEKKSYRLLDAEIVGDHLRQVYVHRAPPSPSQPPDSKPSGGGSPLAVENAPMDEVVELWWDWK